MLPVSLTFAGALALINLWLAYRITRLRIGGKVMLGDGADTRLLARMRAQANFAEYTPFVLILIALIELAGGSRSWLWGAGIVYVLARIAHGFGMDPTAPKQFRAGGALVTWITLFALALWAIWVGAHVPKPGEVHFL